jgi:hypothetical protein
MYPNGKLEIRVVENEYIGTGKEMFIFIDNEKTERTAIGEIVFKETEQYSRMNPTIVLTRRDEKIGNDPFHKLIDDLWNLGYRPKNFQQEMTSDIKRHLNDMRLIVFKKLGIENANTTNNSNCKNS